jgi:hypothetical protein
MFTREKQIHPEYGEVERAELYIPANYFNNLLDKDFEKVGEFFQYEIDLVEKSGYNLLNYTIVQYTPGMIERPSEKPKILYSNIDGYELMLVSIETNKKLKIIKMIDKIKELRVQIDGLAQLTKELKPLMPVAIDLAYIPDSWSIDKFIEWYKATGYYIIDSNKKGDGNKAIIKLPNTYKEIENSYNSLILAKAWLGQILKELGTESPYKSGYKTK